MSLGFSVDELLPKARGGGVLKMGLARLTESEWLQPDPDLAARAHLDDRLAQVGQAGTFVIAEPTGWVAAILNSLIHEVGRDSNCLRKNFCREGAVLECEFSNSLIQR